MVIAPQVPEVVRDAGGMRPRRRRAVRVRRSVRIAGVSAGDADSGMPWLLSAGALAVAWTALSFEAELGLRGKHQVENWAVAVRLADLFYKQRREHISRRRPSGTAPARCTGPDGWRKCAACDRRLPAAHHS